MLGGVLHGGPLHLEGQEVAWQLQLGVCLPGVQQKNTVTCQASCVSHATACQQAGCGKPVVVGATADMNMCMILKADGLIRGLHERSLVCAYFTLSKAVC